MKRLYTFQIMEPLEPFECSETKEGSELIRAITTADMDKLQSLIKNGASVNAKSPDALGKLSTPLQVAINHSKSEIVNILLTEGADPNKGYPQDDELFPTFLLEPIFHAFAKYEHDIVLALIRGGAKVDIRNYSANYPLHLATELGWSDVVNEIILRKISLQQTDGCHRTPCMLAAQLGKVNILRILLDNEAEIDYQNVDGKTALMYAVRSFIHNRPFPGYEHCIKLLLERNADVNIVDSKLNNVIMGQLYNWTKPRKHRVLVDLVDAGCSINSLNRAGYAPLHMAVSSLNLDLIHSFIDLGADVNKLTGKKKSALYEVSRLTVHDKPYDEKLWTELAKCLLGYHADPNITHPLAVAAVYNRLGLVDTLLHSGASINDVHPKYGTVLFNAAVVGNLDMVKLALSFKAEINISNIPRKHFPYHPEKADKFALMLLFAAGEDYPFLETPDRCVPRPILDWKEDKSLRNQCRIVIRDEIIMSNNHNQNLFEATKPLPIPNLLKDYILFWVSPHDDQEQFDTKFNKEEEDVEDDNKSCLFPLGQRDMFL